MTQPYDTNDDEPLPAEAEGQNAPESEQADEGTRPLTKAEFDRLWAEREQRLTSRLQSMTDKAESRIAKRYEELSAGNKRAVEAAKGMGMSPEVLAAYEKRLDDDALRQAMQNEPKPAPPNGQVDDGDIDPRAVSAEGSRLYVELGLEADDPERALIQTTGVSPQQYLQSIRYAAKMKERRLQAEKAAPPKPGQVPGLVRGGKAPPKNPIENIQSADELYDMAWNDMKKKASG